MGLMGAVLVAQGCEGKKEGAPAEASQASSPQGASSVAQRSAASPEGPTAPDDSPGADSAPEGSAPDPDDAKAADPLGQRFIDPPWFRRDMLPDAKAIKVSRSEANDQGLFSSQILLELPEGTTAEQCADRLTEKVSTTVPNLERKVQSDGRIMIAGSTDRYRVTLMCGDAKGVMRAFVSFEWTS